ncbi:hypothetical protein [Streptomyces sp. NPDC050585]|uniref:hypothetical protein n=1 Tax=Streptomyces sp. NPDC050585 TaxID=3365632 RepID=UPI0037B50781
MARDIGLSWMAAQCDAAEELPVPELDCLAEEGPVAATARIAARSVAAFGAEASLALWQDVRLLRDSPLSDEAIRTVWLGATDHIFDPARDGVSARDWLARLEEAWLTAARHTGPGPVPPATRPVRDEEDRRVVLGVIRTLGPLLAFEAERHACPLPLAGLVPALEQVTGDVCPGLGYRLLLRALKSYCVPVGRETADALTSTGARFGFSPQYVHAELNLRL